MKAKKSQSDGTIGVKSQRSLEENSGIEWKGGSEE